MSNKWKELDINKCSEWPDDLLTNKDYVWQVKGLKWFDIKVTIDPIEILKGVGSGNEYRYRLRQPEPPTHKEIMTLWFMSDNNNWLKVLGYQYTLGYFIGEAWKSADWFTGRKSAEIPPEAE